MNKRILLIEDDVISREFLYEAIVGLGIPIDTADTLLAATDLARQRIYTLLLCDVHLPDGDPIEIFGALSRLQTAAKIVAITAEASEAVTQDLTGIGYLEVWGKPISMKSLRDNIMRLLGTSNRALQETIPSAIWDEAAALRAVGNNHATLAALKTMFLAELPKQAAILRDAFHGKRIADLKAECHKLLAACGFVGAIGLNDAVRQLSEKPEDADSLGLVMQQTEQYLASR